jgi:hypothetical protein
MSIIVIGVRAIVSSRGVALAGLERSSATRRSRDPAVGVLATSRAPPASIRDGPAVRGMSVADRPAGRSRRAATADGALRGAARSGLGEDDRGADTSEAGAEPRSEAGVEPPPDTGVDAPPETGVEPPPDTGVAPPPEAGVDPASGADSVGAGWAAASRTAGSGPTVTGPTVTASTVTGPTVMPAASTGPTVTGPTWIACVCTDTDCTVVETETLVS